MSNEDDDEDASRDEFSASLMTTSYMTAQSQLDLTIESSSQLDCCDENDFGTDNDEANESGCGFSFDRDGSFDDDDDDDGGSIDSQGGSDGHSHDSGDSSSVDDGEDSEGGDGVDEQYLVLHLTLNRLMKNHGSGMYQKLVTMAHHPGMQDHFKGQLLEVIECFQALSQERAKQRGLFLHQYAHLGDDGVLAEFEDRANSDADERMSACARLTEGNAARHAAPPRTPEHTPSPQNSPSPPPRTPQQSMPGTQSGSRGESVHSSRNDSSSCPPSAPQTPAVQRRGHRHDDHLLTSPLFSTSPPLLQTTEPRDIDGVGEGGTPAPARPATLPSRPPSGTRRPPSPPSNTPKAARRPDEEAETDKCNNAEEPSSSNLADNSTTGHGQIENDASNLNDNEGKMEGSNDTRTDEEVDAVSLCIDAYARLDACGERSLIVMVTRLRQTIHLVIENVIFDPQRPQNLHLIVPMAKKVLRILAPLKPLSRHLSTRLSLKAGQVSRVASKLAKMPDFNEGFNDILVSLDEAAKQQPENEIEEPADVTEALSKLRDAISEHPDICNDDDMADIITLGDSMMYTISHLLHLCIFYEVICILTVHQVFMNLDEVLLERASQLAADINPEFQLDESTSLLDYFVNILIGGLADSSELASQVLCDVKQSITQIRHGREELIFGAFQKAGQKHAKGGMLDYCADRAKSMQRLRITVLSFCLLGQGAIRRRVSNDSLFDRRGGVAQSILRLSPDLTYLHCKRLLTSEFFTNETKRSETVEHIRKEVIEQKRKVDKESGKCNIILESMEQIDSLRELITMISRT